MYALSQCDIVSQDDKATILMGGKRTLKIERMGIKTICQIRDEEDWEYLVDLRRNMTFEKCLRT